MTSTTSSPIQVCLGKSMQMRYYLLISERYIQIPLQCSWRWHQYMLLKLRDQRHFAQVYIYTSFLKNRRATSFWIMFSNHTCHSITLSRTHALVLKYRLQFIACSKSSIYSTAHFRPSCFQPPRKSLFFSIFNQLTRRDVYVSPRYFEQFGKIIIELLSSDAKNRSPSTWTVIDREGAFQATTGEEGRQFGLSNFHHWKMSRQMAPWKIVVLAFLQSFLIQWQQAIVSRSCPSLNNLL